MFALRFISVIVIFDWCKVKVYLMRTTFTTLSSGCVEVRYFRELESPTCEAQALTLTVFSIGIERTSPTFMAKIASLSEILVAFGCIGGVFFIPLWSQR